MCAMQSNSVDFINDFSRQFLQVIMEAYDYETSKVKDVTSDKLNRKILRCLRKNDLEFDELWVCNRDHREGNFDEKCREYGYSPDGAFDIGLLGYFIGKNTILKEFAFWGPIFQDEDIDDIKPLFKGVNHNRSIQKLFLEYCSVEEICHSLSLFFENNHNLSEIVLEQCVLGAGCIHQLSLAIGSCNSLKCIKVENIAVHAMGDDRVAAGIIIS